MGIEIAYRRLAESELEALEADPERAMSYLFSIPGFDDGAVAGLLTDPAALQARGPEMLAALQNIGSDPTRVDLGKDWHALHFLLCGDTSLDPKHRPNEPLHNVVMGGDVTSLDGTYGPVRKFGRDDLRQIVDALASVSVEALRARFSAEAFNAARIYPNPSPGGMERGRSGRRV